MFLSQDAALTPRGPALDDEPPSKPRRDYKKLALIVGLSALAWVSTYTGMLELIQANLGEVSLVEKVAIGMAVAMLQIMIVWLLDQLFSPIGIATKSIYAVGYLFLTLISVGFAFGFYWKVLESRSESTRSAETSVGQVQNALRGAETRLDQLQATLVELAGISTQKADQEAQNGNTCPGSRPGNGPRMAMRRGDAERFTFASTFVKGRADQVKGDIKALDGDLQKILKDDKSIVDQRTGTRNEFLKGMGRKLDETTARYNALRTDPQLLQIRQDAHERAEKTTFPDSKGGTYSCPDGQLQSALRGVVAAIDKLPVLEKPKLSATEGSEAVIEAFRRLTTTLFGALQLKLPPTPEELREKQKKAVLMAETPAAAQARAVDLEAAGLGKRDYIPLGIAVFVDFCLLLVSFGRPVNRFVAARQHMAEAEAGPVNQILGNFREIHDDRVIRRNFEMFQHVIFHYGRHYLAAIPLAAPKTDVEGKPLDAAQRRQLQIEAQTLTNLFSGLEQGNVIERGMPPFLALLGGTRLIRSKLRRQDSKFANAGAFRIYVFKNRAWPEMILGAIMGAAKRHEEDLRRKRLEAAEREAEITRLESDLARLEVELRKEEMVHEANFKKSELTLKLEARKRLLERQLLEAEAAAEAESRRVAQERAEIEARRRQEQETARAVRAVAGQRGGFPSRAVPGLSPQQGATMSAPAATAWAPGPRGAGRATALETRSAEERWSAEGVMPAAPMATALPIAPGQAANHNTVRPGHAAVPMALHVPGPTAPAADNVIAMPDRTDRTSGGEPRPEPVLPFPRAGSPPVVQPAAVQLQGAMRTAEPATGTSEAPRETAMVDDGQLDFFAPPAHPSASAGPTAAEVDASAGTTQASAHVVPVEEAPSARERAAWSAVDAEAFEAHQRRLLGGRGALAAVDSMDASIIAQRLAPPSRLD